MIILSKVQKMYLGIVLLATFVCMSPSLKNEFVSNDDNLHVYDNPAIRGLDAEHIEQIFTHLFNPTYVPLTALSFAVEYHFVKYHPFLYHLDNLLLHLAVTALVFYFALQIGLPSGAALVGALLFGVHPMHVESVAWVTERKDVLYSLFYMLALCCYWEYLKKKDGKLYVATVMFGLLSILSKSMALSLPLVMLLCDWMQKRKFDKWMVLDKIPHFVYIIPITLVTYLANARNPIQHGAEAFLLWIWCFVFYFYKFLFPTDLVIFYRFPQPFSLATPEFALSLLVFILLIVAVWRFRKYKLFIFAIAFYVLSIFFLFRFDDIKYLPPVSDRFMYLPSVGFCFLFGYWIDKLYHKTDSVILTMVLAAAVFLLGGKSFIQTQVWRDSITFWSHELHYYPDNAMALVNRGEAYRDIEKHNMALADFNTAIASDPEYAEAYNSRGQIYGMNGRVDAALQDFLKVIELKPNFDEAYNNIGIIYAMKKDMGNAVSFFKKAADLDPLNTEAYYNLGSYYFLQDDFGQALSYFQKVLAINPEHTDAKKAVKEILARQKPITK